MAIRPVVVCDLCGGDGPAQHYRIVLPDGVTWEVDLCTEGENHSEILEQFRTEGWGAPVKRGGRRRTFKVTQLDEIGKEAKKRP